MRRSNLILYGTGSLLKISDALHFYLQPDVCTLFIKSVRVWLSLSQAGTEVPGEIFKCLNKAR